MQIYLIKKETQYFWWMRPTLVFVSHCKSSISRSITSNSLWKCWISVFFSLSKRFKSAFSDSWHALIWSSFRWEALLRVLDMFDKPLYLKLPLCWATNYSILLFTSCISTGSLFTFFVCIPYSVLFFTPLIESFVFSLSLLNTTLGILVKSS